MSAFQCVLKRFTELLHCPYKVSPDNEPTSKIPVHPPNTANTPEKPIATDNAPELTVNVTTDLTTEDYIFVVPEVPYPKPPVFEESSTPVVVETPQQQKAEKSSLLLWLVVIFVTLLSLGLLTGLLVWGFISKQPTNKSKKKTKKGKSPTQKEAIVVVKVDPSKTGGGNVESEKFTTIVRDGYSFTYDINRKS